MTIQHLIRKVRSIVLLKPEDGGEVGGASAGVIDAPAAAVDAAPPSAPVEPAAPTDAPSAGQAAEPATMFDALEAHWSKTQPRQPDGKFAGKADGTPGADAVNPQGEPKPEVPADKPTAQQQKPGDKPAIPGAEEDLTQMPEGLTPKAQDRFQKLANSNRELTQWRQEYEPQINYVRSTFQEHGVSKEQFDQAVQFIGAVNRGDMQTAQRIIGEEFAALSLLTGKQLDTPDPLASFPDLRSAVDGLQITEAHALELARGRRVQQLQQQNHQAQQQADQQTQTQERERQAGVTAVENFCKRMQAHDLDYSAIEAHLIPVIPQLLQGAHPSQWGAIVEQQYKLIKSVAGSSRQQAPAAASQTLRPTGAASPAAVPRTAFEAMFKEPDPRLSGR